MNIFLRIYRCSVCTYRLDLIKYIVSPCPQCILSNGKERPMTIYEYMKERKSNK